MALPSLVSISSVLFLSTTFSLTGVRAASSDFQRRAPPSELPGTWQSVGCYTDNVAKRTLPSATYQSSTSMNAVNCIAFCDNAGFSFAGTEFGQECFCGNIVDSSSSERPSGECTMPCSGDQNESCGGANRINVYWDGVTPPAAPVTNPGVNGWVSMGCYSDGPERTLPTLVSTDGPITIAKCIMACQSADFNLAGTQYSQECYCANEFHNGGSPVLEGECSMTCAGNSSEFCGAGFRLNVYTLEGAHEVPEHEPEEETPESEPVPEPTPTPTEPEGNGASEWSYLGCYTDSVTARTLAHRMGTQGPVTSETCTLACETAGYTLAGMEYSTECYCGDAIDNGGVPASSGCDMPCQGDEQQMCGGPNRLTVYQFGSSIPTATPTPPPSPPGPEDWSSIGCYSDDVVMRALPVFMGAHADMTTDKCVALCVGYTYAGVEYANECFCGDAFQNGHGPAADGCTMACTGDPSQVCGGPNRLSVYEHGTGSQPEPTGTEEPEPEPTKTEDPEPEPTETGEPTPTETEEPTPTQTNGPGPTETEGPEPPSGGWEARGCHVDNPGARTLTVAMPLGDLNSHENCQQACYESGYRFAGMEYSWECFCDTALKNGGGPAPDGEVGCNMPCSGDSAQTCGGPLRLTVFEYTGELLEIPEGPGGPNPPDEGNAQPVTEGLPEPWHYHGCYRDNQFGRILGFQLPDSGSLTIESCIAECVDRGYTLAGTQYSAQCFCDNNIVNAGSHANSEGECGMPCSGNSEQACGGPDRMSIYAATEVVNELPVPSAQTEDLPGSWEYAGCLRDTEPGAPARVLPYMSPLEDNSPEKCLNLCVEYGYPAAGLQFGEQCFCGDIEHAEGVEVRPNSECNMPCPGDPTHTCGGPNRDTFYVWNGPPLQTWHYPENKGRYEFLMDGVVIPLMTTLGLNNKIIFVDKFGTGALNSTGSYELDMSLVDQGPYVAHRPLHVKTDVFCAAGLTLPDKASRLLNIGGWSTESTYGLRFYTPDESPGTPGVNDWEEDVNTVALQRGRWYPGVMIMANGSILVVGGQEGANGAPIPDLEVLPKPEGGPTYLYMDWLQRTDPWNLYPYLWVLPHGDILTIYYNEARILDEVTFETKRVLPNLPGAVNQPLGGRSYPLEGTAMLLPQRYPYTDPIEVVACGGSTPGPGVALDNCVSIQPESPDAQWVIERMPSKRVMTCMVTLPDGTFLLMNGAKHGVAGFALAEDPNLEAVLYDPYKLVGERFSVLDSTDIPRLYHSEATLLQDGRVLVSGSDPQDVRFEQEHRLEVFYPPYLTSGLPQPRFTIVETDWEYNTNYTFTVESALDQGARVSLISAVTSTHGTSMNQRILFPNVHCIGVTCTVTAPPNTYICPPGWYQMYVLNGPTPSWSEWVRIGGDPAELGNWPNAPGFNPPGI